MTNSRATSCGQSRARASGASCAGAPSSPPWPCPAAGPPSGPATRTSVGILSGMRDPADAGPDGGGAERVCAVVVTHDRKEMLRGCLSALEHQTRTPDSILVVDNASEDGTGHMLAAEFPRVAVRRLDTNQGGAGGFHEGIRAAYEREFDWLWLMDDDTVPTPAALERLLAGR